MNSLKNYLLSFYKNHQNLTNISLLVILTFIVFYNSLDSYYINFEDFNPILHAKRNIFDIFISNIHGGNIGGDYRPIEVLSHQFDRYFYGSENPFGRHLTNLVIHIFNVIFVYVLAYYLTKNKLIGLLAGLFFAVHVIHINSMSTPVAWIPGRVDTSVTFFYLLTIILFLKFLLNGSRISYLISFVTFVLALMSKEMAATLPLVTLIYVLLFPSVQNGERIFKSILKILLASSILLIILGIIFNPNFVASILSSDGKLEQSTIDRIYYSQFVAVISGGVLMIVTAFIFVISKISPKVYTLLLSVGYSIPYFFILFFYLIARFIILKGFGGYYESVKKGNAFFQFGFDAFLRDMFGLTGLVWPLGDDFVVNLFKLQVEHDFIFYVMAVIIATVLVLILYRLVTLQSKILTFSYLWIFLTLIPAHNLLFVNGDYTTRYLYLPSIGFCIFISILLLKLLLMKKKIGRLSNVMILLFILFTVSLSSHSIIRNNEKIKERGKMMARFISDLKHYQSKISDTTNIYFISFPISFILENDTYESLYEYNYINYSVLNFNISPKDRLIRLFKFNIDYVLNFSDNVESYGNHYINNPILFLQGEEKNKINLSWVDEKSFIIDNINLQKYYLINSELPLIDENLIERNNAELGHSVLQSFTSKGEVKETDNAVIEVLEIDKKLNTVKLKVELKDPFINSRGNSVFFLFEKGHLKLVEEFSIPKES